MDWIQINIYTTPEGIEPVSGRLYGLGITGVEIEDEADFKDFLENNRQYWDYVDEELVRKKSGETRVKAYVSDNAAGRELLAAIKGELRALRDEDIEGRFGRLETELDNVRNEDWEHNWRKYYHPLEIGEKILICPEWEKAPESGGRVVFTIEPGLSFGTGSHDTTRLCLESLEKLVCPGSRVLDLGCGSGILSIVSLLLGAGYAHAVDIDPNAVDIAYKNAEKNGISRDRYFAETGNVVNDAAMRTRIADEKYDIVVANIVADVIIAIVPHVQEFMTANGVFLSSGIITDRLEEVKEALLAAGFKIESINTSGDWASVVCRR